MYKDMAEINNGNIVENYITNNNNTNINNITNNSKVSVFSQMSSFDNNNHVVKGV
jgi:hypothetical protein